MLQKARTWLQRPLKGKNHSQSSDVNVTTSQVEGPYAFPVFPPPPPAEILADRDLYVQKLRGRRYGAPKGYFEDSPLYGLYRIYEYLVVDYVTGYRNHIEDFWRQKSWTVRDIPDPQDSDPARYAFLACTTYLLVYAFNERVKLGLVRGGPALFSPEEADEMRNRPDSERKYEEMPEWATKIPPLEESLYMRSHDDVFMDGPDDPRAEQFFRSKNILIWAPHVLFA